MVNVIKEQKGDALIIRLSGSIEEGVEFEKLIGPPAKEMHVFCKEVPRINSIGVKSWIKYFGGAQQAGAKIRFHECSTAIVEQINMISNFAPGNDVDSIYVPFSCQGCGAELVGLFKVADIKKAQLKIPALKCAKCGGSAEFDDIPEEFFAFMSR